MSPPKTRRCGSAASTSRATEILRAPLKPAPAAHAPAPMATITIHLLAADGTLHTLSVKTGRSLMHEAVSAGIEAIAADCGGCLNCATCHVIVDADWAARLPAPAADELSMLEMTAAAREANSRLSCQITLTPTLDGLRARLPATQY